jgi:hypothetical protein
MKNLLAIVFIVVSVKGFGQYYNSSAQTNINFTTAPRGFLTGLPPAQNKAVVGNPYFYQSERLALIYLKDSTKIENVLVRLDMSHDIIEINYNNQIKLLPVSRVLGVSLTSLTGGKNEEFINSSVLFKSGLYQDRLMQVVYSDDVALICKADVHVKEGRSSQNPMLGTGDAEDEIVVKRSYIITNGQTLIETNRPKSKVTSALTEAFGEKIAPALKKTNLKSEADLVDLVKYLNEIAKS